MTRTKLIERLEAAEGGEKEVPQCSDFDEDCEDVPDKVHCWLYDPAKGACPYLKAQGTDDE